LYITSRTRLFALLGDPVAHSLSPAMQNAAFRAAGDDAVYLALRTEAEALPALMRTLARSGGGNVTVPHKGAAAAALDDAAPAVIRTGACNTFWSADGRLHGDNTDVAGLRAAVGALTGGAAGMRVLLIGAGGAAAAALCALLDEGAAQIALLNRSAPRAEALARRLDPAGERVALLSVGGPAAMGGFDLLINATTLGLHDGDPLPLPLDGVRGAVLDMVYRPAETAWVHAARARGLPAADGREMLLQQGAAAYARWMGRAAPVEAMRSALNAAAGAAAATATAEPAP
jgi:shikimate dehydrogenase